MGDSPTVTTKDRSAISDVHALIHYHSDKVRPLLAVVVGLESQTTQARKRVTEAVNIATADLSQITGEDITNKFFLGKIAQAGRPIGDTLQLRKLDSIFDPALGIEVQPDLFKGKGKGDVADSRAILFHQAYNDGLNGRVQREDVDPADANIYAEGFTAGQAVMMLGLKMGAALVEARNTPANGPAVNLDDAPEDDRTDEEKLADAADKLAASGFMQTGQGDAAQDEVEQIAAAGEGVGELAGEGDTAQAESKPADDAPPSEDDKVVTAEKLVEGRRRRAAAAAPGVH